MGLFNRKKWIRFYSMQPGVADLHPIFPARKLKRKWRKEQLKSQAHRDAVSYTHLTLPTICSV